MNIKSIFKKSITDLKHRPSPLLPEIFLIGRSNVGKSSFINFLLNKKKIALVSKTPGKTLTLNYFLLNDSFYLVDSPGYGYMKKSFQIKENVIQMMNKFLQNNLNIKIIFHFIDFKVGPTSLDLEIYQILRQYNFNPILILNKKDKVLINKIKNRLEQIKKIFDKLCYKEIPMYLLSCKSREGLDNIMDLIYAKI
ncbi:ribosome biogenesis GTP-binding protein YihA/YsxC [Columbia Basin potato purple top phytoplasma]|uniref:Probable GTP-binding protein EngB n=1 Tax=Columbia Basin potato purple top phytoplasma TaxID=307134 RepID=A0ABT5L957_9MOLU|nr:ribosome biogenesis GTP-binding protein YihA/YsxC [Columbia Basin potato purple top phytoplasma]MDC9032139.1 ribosome biogenesis GTP-binding protein YihA/YsxC [Columbia Basin potato purple top phytoplasma]